MLSLEEKAKIYIGKLRGYQDDILKYLDGYIPTYIKDISRLIDNCLDIVEGLDSLKSQELTSIDSLLKAKNLPGLDELKNFYLGLTKFLETTANLAEKSNADYQLLREATRKLEETQRSVDFLKLQVASFQAAYNQSEKTLDALLSKFKNG